MSLGSFVNEGNVFFRAPLLLALVWFLWGINTFVFEKVGVDHCATLGFDRTNTLRPMQICSSAVLIFCIYVGCWFLSKIEWPFPDPLVIPSGMYLISLCLLLLPFNVLHRQGRDRLVANLWRVLKPSFTTGILFVEVVMGDILTSLSKALADIQVSLCVLLGHAFSQGPPGAAAAASAAQGVAAVGGIAILEASCAESWLRPLITSLPFLLRLRQCIVAYMITGKAFPHLVNATKYASALPVIWISTFAHHFPASYGLVLRKAWLISITFNSFFSFLWDVVMDFGLFRSDTEYMFLRRTLYYMSWSGDSRGGYSTVPVNEHTRSDAGDPLALPTRAPKSKDSSGSLKSLMNYDQEDTGALETEDLLAVEMSAPAAARASSPRPAGRANSIGSSGSEDASRKKIDALSEAASTLVKRTGAAHSEPANDNMPGGMSVEGGPGSNGSAPMIIETPSKPPRIGPRSPNTGGVRVPASRYQPLLPSTPIIYYAAIVLDFLLRVLWSFKLSVHLHLTSEGLTFVLEMCEVFRRFLWLFFRIEWQYIEMQEDERLAAAGAAMEDGDEQDDAAHLAGARQAGTTRQQIRSRSNVDRP